MDEYSLNLEDYELREPKTVRATTPKKVTFVESGQPKQTARSFVQMISPIPSRLQPDNHSSF